MDMPTPMTLRFLPAALLIAAVAGAAMHIPGGWGVLDFVILKSLSGGLDPHRIVAGVLVYRAAY